MMLGYPIAYPIAYPIGNPVGYGSDQPRNYNYRTTPTEQTLVVALFMAATALIFAAVAE